MNVISQRSWNKSINSTIKTNKLMQVNCILGMDTYHKHEWKLDIPFPHILMSLWMMTKAWILLLNHLQIILMIVILHLLWNKLVNLTICCSYNNYPFIFLCSRKIVCSEIEHETLWFIYHLTNPTTKCLDTGGDVKWLTLDGLT